MNMKRKLNALELRRQHDKDRQQQQENDKNEQQGSPKKKRSALSGSAGGGSPKRVRVSRCHGSSLARREDPREHQDLNREEITLMFMEISEKIDRCFDFDLQKWLGRYESLRLKEDTNFPEAAMLLMSAAQIYGRKVDYLEEIILHMDQDQKGRDEDGGERRKDDKPTAGGRKRVARFQPQSLSDCFTDLEFTVADVKKTPIASLVTGVKRVAVDQRNKFQQMQELCIELRTMPSKQRRQEILNRLRDDASIPPIMSSHNTARKNQILDLESGETIGTRYDFQIHLNFFDVKSGLLMPEHDLKRFFQRCDVIDYLYELQESEDKNNDKFSKQTSIFPLKPRELKIYLPPDYLKNKYRIEIDDTTDFDNELHMAKSTNYRNDPILKLMQSKFADPKHMEPWAMAEANPAEDVSFSNILSSTLNQDGNPESQPVEQSSTLVENSGTVEQDTDQSYISSTSEDASHSNSTAQDPMQASIIVSIVSEHNRDEFSQSKESSPEPELMALENQSSTTVPDKPSEQQRCSSRLSLEDEGIGIDRESLGKQTPSDLARSPSLDKLSDGVGGTSAKEAEVSPVFGTGQVIPTSGSGVVQTISLKPALLELNLLKIPECHLRKHLLFSLPPEYKRLKVDLVRKASDRTKDIFNLAVYSLNPRGAKNSEWMRRASTPELEEFHGFDEYDDILQGPNGKCLYSLAPLSDDQQSNASRPSSPESDFFGFENDEPTRGIVNEDIARVADLDEYLDNDRSDKAQASCETLQKESSALPESTQLAQTSESQQSTPTRTMSRDSGISDDQNESALRQSRSKEPTPEPSDDNGDASPEPAVTNTKYIQSVAEAKELMEKVNSWHRKLKPILTQSEKRNHFDIHAYGTEIIDSFGPEETVEDVSVISFAQVMESKPQDYTARYFLSMLMLANTNNVQIVAQNRDPERLTTKEDIELRLLSRKRHHQEMESIGDRIPCDNTPSGRSVADTTRSSKSPRGQKRKRIIMDEEEPDQDEPGALSGICRLREDNDDPDHDFLERIQRIYPDMNCEEIKRKRIAFRRGMRRCAYGLQDETQPSITKEPIMTPPEPPDQIEAIADEILSVDLMTNEAILMTAAESASVAVAVDPDPCCSKSLISTSESGYGSMINGSDC